VHQKGEIWLFGKISTNFGVVSTKNGGRIENMYSTVFE
jgi:hypothetical protein